MLMLAATIPSQEKLQKIQEQMKIINSLQAEKAKVEAAQEAALDSEIAKLEPVGPLPSQGCFWPQYCSAVSREPGICELFKVPNTKK